MKKTFLIGFIGLFLVGGFMVGLYLINRPTNPFSSASGPEEAVNLINSPTPVEVDAAISFEICKKSYAKRPADSDFNKACDLNKDGKIDLLDLQKLK